MITESKIKKIIEEVLSDIQQREMPRESETAPLDDACEPLCDLTAINLKKQLLVPAPANRDAYLKFKGATPARLGIWRAGPRYLTSSLLRFRADHATAQDAVFNEVSDEFLKKWGLLLIQSRCRDKDQFLTRPDLGRVLDEENAEILRVNCKPNPRVQIFIADGLSSTAVEVNAQDTYRAIVQGLKGYGIEPGTPFFLRFGRVPSMDVVSEILGAEVTLVLIGERPGLATAESLGCYMAYRASQEMPESNRTVLSNIHKEGTPAVEAGAHIADIVKKMLDKKASGLALNQ